MKLARVFGLTLLAAALACGGGNNDSSNTADNGGDDDGGGSARGTGSMVYTFVAEINGKTENAVHVLDVASGSDNVFAQEDGAEDDVNASSAGNIAQIIGHDSPYTMLVTDKRGTTVYSWDFKYDLSFVLDGPQISPDGTKVAFTLSVPGDDDRGAELIVANADGSDLANLHRFPSVQNATWTPDGRILAVDFADVLTPATTLYVSNAELTTLAKVATPAFDGIEDPVMTPDGKYVVYSLEIDSVYALEVATGNISRLTKDGVNQFRPTLSPDGKHLAFQQQCCSANAIPTVYVIPFDPSKTVSADYDALEPLKDNTGDLVNAGGRLGWF